MSLHIFKNNEQSGPFEDSYIVENLRKGVLLPNDLACRDGMDDWQPLGGLFPLEVAAVSPNYSVPTNTHQVPKCMVCGYIGPFKKEPMLAAWEIVTAIILLVTVCAWFVFLLIRIMRPKAWVCPKCGAKGLLTFVY